MPACLTRANAGRSGVGLEIGDSAVAAETRSWEQWNDEVVDWYTVGLEEELMLLTASDHSLAHCSDGVLAGLSDALRGHTSPETHAAVVELATGIHHEVPEAVNELAGLRERFACELALMDMAAACAGMHPLDTAQDTKVSAAERYRRLSEEMRSLATREPTMALHVHVGIPDRESAVRVLNRLREAVPALLALSSNSPFCAGRDTGFASMRTMIFTAFPRTGTARAFDCYDDYVDAIDPLIRSGAVPDPTFLWWDVRLQPRLGTVEVRVMDAQSSVWESAALAALVQSMARLELEGEPRDSRTGGEVLAENRFLAARDGMRAGLIDPQGCSLVAVRNVVDGLVRDCRPHAARLGCSAQLEDVRRLASLNGATRQRYWVRMRRELRSLPSALAQRFVGHGMPSIQLVGSHRRSD
jgi:carboxylate-amine ligase